MPKYENVGKVIDQNNPTEVFEAKINMIIQECRDFDSGEISQIMQFIKDVRKGEMATDDALEKARAMEKAKSSYH